MKNSIQTCFITFALALALLTLTGCGKHEEAAQADAPPAKVDPKLEAVLLDAEPAGAVTVLEARESAKPGADIAVRGRIAGADEPFTESYALFVLADDSLETCDAIPEDKCPTPWDACCETPEKIRASRLSVQVITDDGSPVRSSLKGVGSLSELDEVIVTGTVADSSTPDNLIINARGIYRKQ